MPNRVLKDQNYRFGFNGKEADREGQWGSTEHYDYGFRIYDPKLGRFLSVDPLTSSYPWYTPYQFAGNKPIAAIDLDGLEEWFTYNSFTNSVSRAKLIPGQRGPLNLDEANEMGLYSSDQIHHMVFDKSYATALNASLEARREKAIARRNFEEQKALNSNFLYNGANISDLRDYAEAGVAAYGGDFVKAAGILAISFAPEALERIAKGSQRWRAAQRLQNHIDNRGGNFDISLGSRDYISMGAKATNSVPYNKFFIKGFTENEIPLKGKLEDWFPGVEQSINTAIENGGRIKFHLDGIDVNALYNNTHINFDGGTITELRYLNDSNNLGSVDFYKGGQPATDDLLQQVNKALKKYSDSNY